MAFTDFSQVLDLGNNMIYKVIWVSPILELDAYQVIQSDLFIPDRWRSLNLWKGHLTIPKRSQTIAR